MSSPDLLLDGVAARKCAGRGGGAAVLARPEAGRKSGMGNSAGFTYLWVLFLVVIMGLALSATATVWHTASQREREAELLFVGTQFRRAIVSYYEGTPGGQKKYPQSLNDLLQDKRLPLIKRHLRKIFVDPMTGSAEWGLIEVPGAGIIGVHSLSVDRPLKVSGFPSDYVQFAQAQQYSEWVFAAASATAAPGTPGPGSAVAASADDRGAQPRPVAAIPRPPPADDVSPQDRDQIRKRVEQLCGLEKSADLGQCDEIRSTQGDAAASRCRSSASLREQVCLRADGTIPPALDANM